MPPKEKKRVDKPRTIGPVIEAYDYEDENGVLVFQVTRHHPKTFLQRRPHPVKGWESNLNGVVKELYRLPALLAGIQRGDNVYLVEGEKDVHTLESWGLTATTNAGGAGAWGNNPRYIETLKDATWLYVLPDNDKAGRLWADKVRASLPHARVINLPDLAEKGDVSDWASLGNTAEALIRLAEQAATLPAPTLPASPGAEAVKVEANEPLRYAEAFLKEHSRDGVPTIRRHQEIWRMWTGTHYEVRDQESMKGEVCRFLDRAYYPDSRVGPQVECSPDRKASNRDRDRNEVLFALGSIKGVRVPEGETWLDGVEAPGAGPFLPCTNGLLDLSTRILYPHSPSAFNRYSVNLKYDVDAKASEWLGFLASVWGDAPDCIRLLQEWFGYVLSGDLSLHKIMLLVGPPRSGKSTIAHVLTEMIGECNVASPTLGSLGEPFGLQPLIDKPLATIPEARLDGRADAFAISERLLSISGGDRQSISRKYQTPLQTVLPTRFLLLSNEVPALRETSGALSKRFLILPMTISHLGKEDLGLGSRLLGELPGILNWALDGYALLSGAGAFTTPECALEHAELLADSASPLRPFLREECVTGPNYHVDKSELYGHYRNWAEANGHHPLAKNQLGRQLSALGVKGGKRGAGGKLLVYEGVTLQSKYAQGYAA
jgi:putative DNA primase/helicase